MWIQTMMNMTRISVDKTMHKLKKSRADKYYLLLTLHSDLIIFVKILFGLRNKTLRYTI